LTEDTPEKPPNYETVIAINTGKETVEDESEATELELGPNNNCRIDHSTCSPVATSSS